LPFARGGRAVSTITLVFVCLWNALLLVALVIVLLKRECVLRWVTAADQEERNGWEWDEFLAGHPELTDDGVRGARDER
jgi:hypothetical protein